MNCPFPRQNCDSCVKTVGAGTQCTDDCVCDILETLEKLKKENELLRHENARLKADIKTFPCPF